MAPHRHLPDTPFTPADARAMGITARQLQQMVHDVDIRRVLTGVYVAGHVPDSIELRCAAARRVLTSHAVVCDRTAAWLWNVDTFDYRELDLLPPLETYVVRGHHRSRRPECDGGVRQLLPDEIVTIEGVNVTTPVRTAVDLACKLPERDGLAAVDGFRREHGLTDGDLRRQLVRHFRRRGVVRARRVVAWSDPRAESPGESRTRWELLRRGLPAPQLQWSITVGGREVCRLDMAYARHRIAVEYDGREFHEGEERCRHDRQRRKWLERNGWTVIVVTRDDCSADAVDAWVARVTEGLRLGGHDFLMSAG